MTNDEQWRSDLNVLHSALSYKLRLEADARLCKDRQKRQQELEQARAAQHKAEADRRAAVLVMAEVQNKLDAATAQVETLRAALAGMQRALRDKGLIHNVQPCKCAICQASDDADAALTATPDAAQEPNYKERLKNALKAYAALLRVIKDAEQLVYVGKNAEAWELLNSAVQCVDGGEKAATPDAQEVSRVGGD